MTFTNPICTRIWMFLNKFRFSHEIAQEYELRSQRDWLDRNFEKVYAEIKYANAYLWFREWFSDEYSFKAFQQETTGKTCLEIGSGPAGNIIYLKGASRRIIIDTLIWFYRNKQRITFGNSWFEGIELISTAAEVLQDNLVGAVDGCIICRNTLDHCADPMQVLENIAEYAAPGCYLLIWTDLYHPGGHDEGHRDITRNPAAFTRKLCELGFTIEYVTPKKAGRKTIHYGCCARKGRA